MVIVDEVQTDGFGMHEATQEARTEKADSHSRFIHMDIDSLTPYVGRIFDSLEEAFSVYNAFAFRRGFGIRKNSSCISRKDYTIVNRKEYLCHKEGFRREGRSIMFRRSTKRTGCMARMVVKLNNDKRWVVSRFMDDHMHEMIDNSKVMQIYSHNTYHRSDNVRRIVSILFEIGIRPCTIRKILNFNLGMYDPPVTTQNVCDITRNMRNHNTGNECAEVMKCFFERKVNDNEFFFSFELDDEGTLKHLFWADKRSQHDYAKFNDVVVFDVTYRTNRLSLPFAPFTGVNHHFQSTLFAAGFIGNEQTTSFVWLFKQFLQCMGNVHPAAIITDQDHAICSAVAEVFPNTIHRYCIWHIRNHIKEHLMHLFAIENKDFTKDYHNWFHSSSSDDEQTAYTKLHIDYGVQNNSWFERMYKRKEHWVPCYLKDFFWAGMTTTQRSESINSFFDNYVNSCTPISLFVSQYDKAVNDRRSKENSEDFKTIDSQAPLFLGHVFEKQAATHYTRTMYYMFSEEFREGFNLSNCSKSKTEFVEVFKVTERVDNFSIRDENAYNRSYEVNYDERLQLSLHCECGLFIFKGIPCRHILHVMYYKQFPRIPSAYLLDRWGIGIRYTILEDQNAREIGVNPLFYQMVKKKLDCILDAVGTNQTFHDRIDVFLTGIQEEMTDDCLNDASNDDLDAHLDNAIEPSLFEKIQDPTHITTKGRPRNATRIKSSREIAMEKSTSTKRACRTCRQVGHNSATCPVLKQTRNA